MTILDKIKAFGHENILSNHKTTIEITNSKILAIVVVTAITVLSGFKDTGLVDNTVVDKFINGLAIFGTFIGVIVLAIVGKSNYV